MAFDKEVIHMKKEIRTVVYDDELRYNKSELDLFFLNRICWYMEGSMSEYQLEIKQIVDYPRCRIYRQFIQNLMA